MVNKLNTETWRWRGLEVKTNNNPRVIVIMAMGVSGETKGYKSSDGIISIPEGKGYIFINTSHTP